MDGVRNVGMVGKQRSGGERILMTTTNRIQYSKLRSLRAGEQVHVQLTYTLHVSRYLRFCRFRFCFLGQPLPPKVTPERRHVEVMGWVRSRVVAGLLTVAS